MPNPSAYRNLGFHTFEIVFDPVALTKVPKIAGWRDAEVGEPTQARNYGCRIPQGILIVDVDTKRSNGKVSPGAESFEKLKTLVEDWDSLGERYIVRTMNGGYHHYFRVPEGYEARYEHPQFPGIQFLQQGRYVVGPGTDFTSDFPDSFPYLVTSGTLHADCMPELPQALQAILLKATKEVQEDSFDYRDDPHVLKQFERNLKAGPIAIEGAGGDHTTFCVAAEGRDLGITPDTCYEMMLKFYNPRCQPAWSPMELRQKVDNAYEYGTGGIGAGNYANYLEETSPEEITRAIMELSINAGAHWDVNKYNEPKPNSWTNICNFIVAKGGFSRGNEMFQLFRWNEFTHRVEYSRVPYWARPKERRTMEYGQIPLVVDEEQVQKIRRFMSQAYRYNAEEVTLYKAIEWSAKEFRYHPIQLFLRSLIWDGVPRLDRWLHEYLDAEDNAYTRQVGSIVLMGACKRALEPGCKFDYVMILEGPQGSQKSMAVEVMSIDKTWFATLTPGTDKDTRLVMAKKWIVELAEIDQLYKGRNAPEIKSFISTPTDTIRPPYGKMSVDYNRCSICIGTINLAAEGTYFEDPTGNRRFWPVEVGDINLAGLKQVMPQLYAEAMHRMKNNEVFLYLTGEAHDMADEIAKQRQSVDPWLAPIKDWWMNNPGATTTLTALFVEVIGKGINEFSSRERKRIMRCCQECNCEFFNTNKESVRQKEMSPLNVVKALGNIEEKIETLRRNLNKPITVNVDELYMLLSGDLDTELETEAKQSLGRRFFGLGLQMEKRYVQAVGNIVRYYTLTPWEG